MNQYWRNRSQLVIYSRFLRYGGRKNTCGHQLNSAVKQFIRVASGTCRFMFSAGSSLTYHLAPFVLNVMTTSLPSTLPLVAFPKGLFSALYSLSCTPHLSALLSLLFPSTTTFTQMILSSSSLSTHSTSTQAFLTFKTLFNTSLPG